MKKPYLVEACVGDLKDAIHAEKEGADRLEICADLDTGGLTPPLALVEGVMARAHIPVRVMVRPRPGNFQYDGHELEAMAATIQNLKQLNVEGVVMGCLDNNHEIDVPATRMLAQLAYPLQVTFHKAFDETPDPERALSRLKGIDEITDILTSGGGENAFAGQKVLKKLIYLSKNIPRIIAAGRVTHENLPELHAMIGAPAYHGKKIVTWNY